jgi:hypothetical protein
LPCAESDPRPPPIPPSAAWRRRVPVVHQPPIGAKRW